MIRKTSETRALAGNIVNAYSESQNSAYSCDYLNGKLLWTNPSPTSAFAGQEVTLSSGNYDFYEIIYNADTNNNIYLSTGRIPKGKGAYLQLSAGVSNGVLTRTRIATYTSDTKLTFNDARQAIGAGSATVENGFVYPIYIVGYNKLF